MKDHVVFQENRQQKYSARGCAITTPVAVSVNDILMKFSKEGKKIVAYADDVVILVKENFYNQIETLSPMIHI